MFESSHKDQAAGSRGAVACSDSVGFGAPRGSFLRTDPEPSGGEVDIEMTRLQEALAIHSQVLTSLLDRLEPISVPALKGTEANGMAAAAQSADYPNTPVGQAIYRNRNAVCDATIRINNAKNRLGI